MVMVTRWLNGDKITPRRLWRKKENIDRIRFKSLK